MIDNERIIEAAKALVETNFAKSLAQIAVACGKSKQYFSDLKTKKASASLSFLDVFCSKYPVNKEYLINGTGSPLLVESPFINTNIATNIGGNNNQNSGIVIEALTQQLQEKDRQIQEQQKLNAKSQEQIDRLLTIIENMNAK